MERSTKLEQVAKEMAATAGKMQSAIDDIVEEFSGLADILEAHALMSSFPERFEILDALLDDPDKSAGFTLVNGNTWLPKALYEARQRQQRKMANKNESAVIWTR